MKTIANEIEVLKTNEQMKISVVKKFEPAIKHFFEDFQINNTNRFVIQFSDYPDILSNSFEHRHYTENCDDIESYFRANLFYLINRNKNLIWKYQPINAINTHNAFLYVFYKPLYILTERLSYSNKLKLIESYHRLASYFIVLGLIKHYLHSPSLSISQTYPDIDEVSTAIALFLIPEFYQISDNEFIKKNHAKIFRRSPHVLLLQTEKREVITAYLHLINSGNINMKDLLKSLNIDEYLLF